MQIWVNWFLYLSPKSTFVINSKEYFLQARFSFFHPANSIKALNGLKKISPTYLCVTRESIFRILILQQQAPFYGHYTGQPASAGTSSKELGDIVGAKFYCLHALADSNQCIRIREKTLEFSSTVLSTPFSASRAEQKPAK